MSETQSEAERNPRGLVYIVRNDTHLAEIYKVGQTYRSIEERLLELNRETSNPGTFEVKATFPVSDRHAAEREAHQKLKEKGLHLKNEFFKGDWEIILQIVEDAQSKYEVKKVINPPVNSNEVEVKNELPHFNTSEMWNEYARINENHEHLISEKDQENHFIVRSILICVSAFVFIWWLFS